MVPSTPSGALPMGRVERVLASRGALHPCHNWVPLVPVVVVALWVCACGQLVDKDLDRAIALFWSAINAGDRVDSALKDMAIVMKQQNRAEEAIEAIKSLRHKCSDQAQESLDNVLLDLYKVRRPTHPSLIPRAPAHGASLLVDPLPVSSSPLWSRFTLPPGCPAQLQSRSIL